MSDLLTLGIEEEVFLVCSKTRLALTRVYPELRTALHRGMGSKFSVEPHPALAEIKTPISENINQLSSHLINIRNELGYILNGFGVQALYSSTHPFSSWQDQVILGYKGSMNDLQEVGQQLMVAGMHIHLGVKDPELRLKLQYLMLPYLPLFLSLSTSSPFWSGRLTGLMSHRTVILDALPRSGFPPYFTDFNAYLNYLDTLVDSGVVDAPGRCWWHIRPNISYPTLELRVCDVCLYPEDAIAIAALFQCLVHSFLQTDLERQVKAEFDPFLQDNFWQARRYGFNGFFLNSNGNTFLIKDLILKLVDELQPISLDLKCFNELNYLKSIIQKGTSAHFQASMFKERVDSGYSQRESMFELLGNILVKNNTLMCA